MNGNKGLAIASYITWIGFLIALFVRDKNDTLVRQHLNQALILNIIATVCSVVARIGGIFATVAGIISIVSFVFWVWGLIRAIKGSEEPLPLIGGIKLFN